MSTYLVYIQRETKHINIDNVINIDFIKENKVLNEVKKSRKIEEAGIWQLKYYIWYLEKRGAAGITGKIDYPLLKKSIEIKLDENDRQELAKKLKEIEKIGDSELPPKESKKAICKKCAYFDLCNI
ncbi:MAG: CRISPR-associated protein Cas4 [Clostridia bacterium]|nr:CRISPR-associated protein Cas4 [Clostridia bacterium]MCI2001203.1 CRISPR-associated protein Cas4 [Clostridia bacterium]MCI2015929.1 CRISPR-associated protein Cas4 [Clostridia bacterium]